jgi:DNA processing protein
MSIKEQACPAKASCPMDRLEALVGLNLVTEVGSIRLRKLLEYFHSPEKVLAAPEEKLRAVSGIGEKIASRIKRISSQEIKNEFSLAKKFGLDILTLDNKAFPENLKEIPDPPIVLYVKGRFLAEDKFSIAIVGSRRASYYGLSSAERFSRDLSLKGLAVVSGMARGVDTSAHQGALRAGGRTIAVMGSGFGQIYPPENKELAQEIARCGAVISEFPVASAPLAHNFPRRNRLISGLSLGVVVVEAARNSGALITADFALEQGREVFALPGKVDSDNSFGTHELIKQGARLITSVEDILDELGPVWRGFKMPPPALAGCSLPPLSGEDRHIYSLLEGGPFTLDELVEKTNLEIPRISGILLRLEMQHLVRQLPGKQWSLNEKKEFSRR